MGCAVSLLSGLGGLDTYVENETMSRLAAWFHYIGFPGLFVDFAILGEGSGWTRDTVLLIIPINIAFYTFLFCGVIAAVNKLPRWVVIVLGTILGIVLLAILVPRIRKFNHYRYAYRSLEVGEREDEVLKEWGPPSFKPACRPLPRWGDDPIPVGTKGCVEELWYSSPVATQEAWGIGFDEDGHAISKYHLILP